MAVDKETLDRWHSEGQKDASEGRSSTLNGPWAGAFESHEDWQARNDAYEAGRENAENNPPEDD